MLEKELALHLDRVYNPKDLIQIFEMLLDDGCGYVQYDAVVSRFGMRKTEAMINRNIIHYRPSATFSRDLQPIPDFGVVSAIGVPSLRAMEQLLERIRKRKKQQPNPLLPRHPRSA
jgi:hypothetical protein